MCAARFGPFNILRYPWPAALLSGKLQARNHGACDLKDESEVSVLCPLFLPQPWGQRAVAVPSLQLVQASRNAGYCETGAF